MTVIKHVTISMSIKQAEAVLGVLAYAIQEEGKREWTNACLRRITGVLKSIQDAVDAHKRLDR